MKSRASADFKLKIPSANRPLRLCKILYFLLSEALFFIYFSTLIPGLRECGNFTDLRAFILFSLIYALLVLWLIRVYNGFYFGFSSVGELVFSQCIASFIANLVMHVLICIYLNRFIGLGALLLLFMSDVLNNLLFSFIGQKICLRFSIPQHTALIYAGPSDLARLREIYSYPHYFKVVSCMENPQSAADVLDELGLCDIVIIAGVSTHIRDSIVKFCMRRGIAAYTEPEIGDILMAGGKHAIGFSIPVLEVKRLSLTPEFRFLNRFFDIAVSLFSIILLSPIMLIAAALIKADDGGPVFYRQTRLTKDGKRFRIIKFRSMRVDAEDDGIARLASENDCRITRAGRFLRACRMDELPQLFNVLAGDMSMVGPRPERPEIAAQYAEKISCFDLRLQVKAGITGYAQVYGKYNTEPYDKLQMDLMYINNMSFLNDLWLLLATFKVLFSRESASGVKAGQLTAEKVTDSSEDELSREATSVK